MPTPATLRDGAVTAAMSGGARATLLLAAGHGGPPWHGRVCFRGGSDGTAAEW